jgi:hypothetical protein
VNQSSPYRPRRLHGEQADVTAVPDCSSSANHLARSVIVVTAPHSFSAVLLDSFAMTEVIAPTDIVGMSLAVEFVSFVLQGSPQILRKY